jgi:hypothetical protein
LGQFVSGQKQTNLYRSLITQGSTFVPYPPQNNTPTYGWGIIIFKAHASKACKCALTFVGQYAILVSSKVRLAMLVHNP